MAKIKTALAVKHAVLATLSSMDTLIENYNNDSNLLLYVDERGYIAAIKKDLIYGMYSYETEEQLYNLRVWKEHVFNGK